MKLQTQFVKLSMITIHSLHLPFCLALIEKQMLKNWDIADCFDCFGL